MEHVQVPGSGLSPAVHGRPVVPRRVGAPPVVARAVRGVHGTPRSEVRLLHVNALTAAHPLPVEREALLELPLELFLKQTST